MQLPACLLGCELPIDRSALHIAAVFIDLKFLRKRGHVGEAAVETLALHDTEFNFSHVQPTAMFGRVVEFQFLAQSSRFVGREGIIK